MKVRVLQLINNFYLDEGAAEPDKKTTPLGEFCVLGYFDALDVKEFQTVTADDTKAESAFVWSQLSHLLPEQINGRTNLRNLICITEEVERDSSFWEFEESVPFYFISMIRINGEKCSSELIGKMKKLEEAPDVITYFSYDHSEVVVVKKSGKYSEGMEHVRYLQKFFNVFKMHTIFAIRETLLPPSDHLYNREGMEEIVDCRLHCVIKDFEEASKFKDELKELLTLRNQKEISWRFYETLGNGDWLLEIDRVSFGSLLACYKMGELLTHTNEKFCNAFFNIESEILLSSERMDRDGNMD